LQEGQHLFGSGVNLSRIEPWPAGRRLSPARSTNRSAARRALFEIWKTTVTLKSRSGSTVPAKRVRPMRSPMA
jgi:hypothetical protein